MWLRVILVVISSMHFRTICALHAVSSKIFLSFLVSEIILLQVQQRYWYSRCLMNSVDWRRFKSVSASGRAEL